ncbi:uncharacterized protein C2845_PM17G00820 [Panicum miliaceum]|uniref:Uncharacterized protein n=1 Tax=Panicum miliaceum TaxID=4540 RepID=A0A3L6Q4Z3_PANMI|nr:uncharacterized protein C2845_PM17G00820 [Panicum miliaceum]
MRVLLLRGHRSPSPLLDAVLVGERLLRGRLTGGRRRPLRLELPRRRTMATTWVRSLNCRSSYAVTDAAVAPSPAKKPPPLPFSCATAAAADVMDAVAYAQQARRKKIGRERDRRREPRPRPKKPKPMAKEVAGALFMPSSAPGPPVTSAFLTMAELPEGHSSRRVVELIFASGWGGASGAPEPSVEALFRVHSASRAVARFEEARAAARAHGAAAWCGADGNEMMRFQCRAPADAPGGVFGAGVATCRLGASASAVRTFACSGYAGVPRHRRPRPCC